MSHKTTPAQRLILAASTALGTAICGCRSTNSSSAPPAKSLYVQAAVAYQEGDKERAASALRQAIAESPDLIMARLLLGSIYRDQGNYSAAADQYRYAVELDPYTASNHYNLGLMYHLLNQLHDAASSYLQALKLNPADVKSNMNIALVYTALGHPEEGLPYAKKAVELDPKSADASSNLGVVLDQMGNPSAAEAAYRKALELSPDSASVALNLAGSLVSQKRYKDAAGVYDQVIKMKDSSLARQRYGYALLQLDRPADAIAQFSAAIRQDAGNYLAFNGLGDAALAQYRASAMLDEKKRTQAVDYWKKSLELNPNQPRVAALVKEYTDKSLFP